MNKDLSPLISRIASDITVAITVFDRRDYIHEAIRSALDQPVPIRVLVVEDCSPDLGLRDFVTSRYGKEITYIQNSRRRGLFDNWNACLSACQTRYLSILHDDDFLLPNFVETMARLIENAPDRGIYFGRVYEVGVNSCNTKPAMETDVFKWSAMRLDEFAWHSQFGFPGNLFRADLLRHLGGFQAGSWFAGDWNAWFRLAASHGGAFTDRCVVGGRPLEDPRRGSTRVERTGRNHASSVVQRKRCFAAIKRLGLVSVKVDDMRAVEKPRLKLMLKHGATFAPRMLSYNIALLRTSHPKSFREWVHRIIASLLTPEVARWISRLWLKKLRIHRSVDYSLRGE